MKHVIDTCEALGCVQLNGETFELVAEAQAMHDEPGRRLLVELKSFLRPVSLTAKERHVRADWLPADHTVNESAEAGECREMTRDIFSRWVRKVRESSPALHAVLH
ncbi:MAG: hypothetical protein FJ404_03305 [Verrucomicrobia bacterium]|nr:hypothetical protein [Verrucomicrobiota bacterium]